MRTFVLAAFFISSVSYAHDHGGGGAAIGKGKGVESYDESLGFVLAKEAIKRLGVVWTSVPIAKTCDLKTAQVISALDRKTVYRLRDQKFKSVKVDCHEMKNGDQVVTHGAEFLRVIEMDLTGGEMHDEQDEHENGNENENSHDE
jgi:hypothetical protein